ncbi:cytochrome c biogenesis protein ResB [Nocardioides panacisoli]|uniref:cytochrome c biogenesis protein ResB n=1 Tax=Nocardioides panacisoli TaxID=627624 RepID=UPI001C6391F9|nr:cytochrome c biogenesis protein ResB [Nocardioides panacisoli]QYJ05421.1 cytochrome c biogenesis protein ResB [Nocardioides panacisoli]
MRTALILLLLLALASVPGSVIPQEDVDAYAVTAWKSQHPDLTPYYESLQMFSVYDSFWFSAIYLLLMVSLVGCIIPRLRVYWRGIRAQPPRTPRNLARLPEWREEWVRATPQEALDEAMATLRRRRFRVRRLDGSIAAERGYLREAGNLVFHTAIIVVLVAFAYGKLFGYTGAVAVVEGSTFTNSSSQYDEFVPGSLFAPDRLDPFALDVDDFDADFLTNGPQAGQPVHFAAEVTYRTGFGQQEVVDEATVEVNHPLRIGDTDVYLVGHGYAPRVTVTDGAGDVAYSGPTIFLPENGNFRSFGVIKAPDASPVSLAFEGQFFPTYGFTMETGPFSTFPQPANPALSMLAYRGDLGLDSGESQSVYALDKSGLATFTKPDGRDFRVDLPLGETVELPEGAGSITFDGLDRFARFQVSQSPGDPVALLGVLLATTGLVASLYVRPQRIWVKTHGGSGATVVEVAGLDRGRSGGVAREIDRLTRQLNRPTETGGPS